MMLSFVKMNSHLCIVKNRMILLLVPKWLRGGVDVDFLDDLEKVLEIGKVSTVHGSNDSSPQPPSPSATTAVPASAASFRTTAASGLDVVGSMETPAASAYQNKCIENWDDICTLFAPDRAIGDGAEQHEEAAAAMENENDNASTSETASGDSNKRLKRDRLADAVSSFAESFKEYVSKSTRPTSQEIYKEVCSVLGISRHQALRAVKRFLNGTFEEFDMLKNLPDDQKLDWIILCNDE
uniref:Uncharacterized protein n=1 Tax=Chenopodium quinoa TaxID=63459 RepID=A0A803M756_CHEQI